MTTDPKSAEKFYAAVMDWSAKGSGAADSQYTRRSTRTTPVAGLMKIPDDACKAGVGPAWMGYIGVNDVDASAARVKAAGGKIHRRPCDVAGAGRMAVAGDPHGAGFMIFKRENASTAAVAETPGHIGWHKLYAGDREAAWSFYSGLFGCTKAMAVDSPAGLYQTFATGGARVGGMLTKPAHKPVPSWLFYFNVDGLAAAIGRVTANRGQILHGPMQVPSNSWIAQCRDPQGAMVAIASCTP